MLTVRIKLTLRRETHPVQIDGGSNVRKVDAHTYEGITDADGEASLTLTQPGGVGVKTHITAKMRSYFIRLG